MLSPLSCELRHIYLAIQPPVKVILNTTELSIELAFTFLSNEIQIIVQFNSLQSWERSHTDQLIQIP